MYGGPHIAAAEEVAQRRQTGCNQSEAGLEQALVKGDGDGLWRVSDNDYGGVLDLRNV